MDADMKISPVIGAVFGSLLALVSCDKADKGQGSADSPVHKGGARQAPVPPNLSGATVNEAERIELGEKIRATDLQHIESIAQDLRKLTIASPRAALDLVDGMPPGLKRDALLRQVFLDYPAQQVAELVQWADQSDFQEDRELIKWVLNSGLTPLLWKEALVLGAQVVSPQVKADLLKYAGAELGRSYGSDFQELLKVTADLSREDREVVLNRYGYEILDLDVGANLSTILGHQEVFSKGLADAALRSAGMSAPEATKEVVTNSSVVGNDPAMISPFIQSWLSADSMAASNWVGSLPEGAVRDHAAFEVASHLIKTGDRRAGEPWIALIQDGKLLEKIRQR